MNNTLIDNSENLKMADTLKKCISNDNCKVIKIATGYWDIPGIMLVEEELRQFLEKDGSELQLLIGTDPIVRAYQQESVKKGRFPEDYIKTDINDLKLKEEYMGSVALLQKYCHAEESESKIKIRVYRTNEEGDAQFLHAKCYIFLGDDEATKGIIGSSNFTGKGLTGNLELNYLENNSMIVTAVPNKFSKAKGHSCWFDELWNISKPWNRLFLEEVLNPSPIGIAVKKQKEEKERTLSPYETYIKYLQTQFGDITDASLDAILKSYLPKKIQSLQYQLDAAKQCLSVMKKHNGFILGDVVGLGKTVVGLLVIKQFIAEAASLDHSQHVLIITPPAIRKSWEDTIAEFDKDKDEGNKIEGFIDFVTTGSVASFGEEADENEDGDEFENDFNHHDYGLIIVDESHNFRNSAPQKYKALDKLIDDITTTMLVQPYVGLLSATPMNNRPADLKNQIYLFQRQPNHSDITGVPDGKLDAFFGEMCKIYDANIKISNTDEGKAALAEMSDRIRRQVLDHILVRRTRTDIKKHYENDSEQLHFPEVCGPHKLSYEMDEELAQLFQDTIHAIAPEEDDDTTIGFYRYCAIGMFKNEEHKKLYEKRNLTVESTMKRLQKIMRILLVKRLESSKTAFKASLNNLRHYTQNMLDMLDKDQVFVCPDIDVNGEFAKANYNFAKATAAIEEKRIKKGGNNLCFSASDFNDDYKTKLENDRKIIDSLYERWSANEDDPKMDAFVESLDSVLFNPQTNTSGKLVIFTESVDTQNAIAKKAGKKHKVLQVSAANRNELQDTIKANFDANASEQRDDYDIIVTTEVLAEGVNLHRANVILNYDTPWNATRLMQRIGRVNRIGSDAKEVRVYNFFPTNESNGVIHLIENAFAKIQSFHHMLGEDSKVFSEREEIPELEFHKYVDGEESELGKYIKELREYQKSNPERYAFIAALPCENLGGTITMANPPRVASVLIYQKRKGFTPVEVDEDDRTHIISHLEMMQMMKCEPSATYAAPSMFTKHIQQLATDCYLTDSSRSLTSDNADKMITKALDIINKLKDNPDIYEHLSKDSQRALKNAKLAVKKKNSTVIRSILRFAKEHSLNQQSLFGIDYDINSWLGGTFAQIVKSNKTEYGPVSVAMTTIKE